MRGRTTVATVLLVFLVASSGCIGFLTGSESLSFEAEPASVASSAANQAGYEHNGTRAQTIERDFEVAGQTRTVEVTNQISSYEKAYDLGVFGEAKLGLFAVISSPAVEVAGETFNPLADYSNEQLVRLLASNYDGLGNVEQVSTREMTVLGTKTTVTKYAATATFKGRDVDVFVHVTKLRDGDDFIVTYGVYPQQLDDGDAVRTMIRAVEHPA